MNGDELKVWRKRRGATQQELAEMLDVSVKTIVRAENEPTPISRMMELALYEIEKVMPVPVIEPIELPESTRRQLADFADSFGADTTLAVQFFLEKVKPEPISDGIGFALWLEARGIAHTRPSIVERLLGPAGQSTD